MPIEIMKQAMLATRPELEGVHTTVADKASTVELNAIQRRVLLRLTLHLPPSAPGAAWPKAEGYLVVAESRKGGRLDLFWNRIQRDAGLEYELLASHLPNEWTAARVEAYVAAGIGGILDEVRLRRPQPSAKEVRRQVEEQLCTPGGVTPRSAS